MNMIGYIQHYTIIQREYKRDIQDSVRVGKLPQYLLAQSFQRNLNKAGIDRMSLNKTIDTGQITESGTFERRRYKKGTKMP
jgi:hypothetical protein